MNSTRVRVTDFLKAKLYDAGSEPVFLVIGGIRATGEGYRVLGDLQSTGIIMNQIFWMGVYPKMTNQIINFIVTKINGLVKKKRVDYFYRNNALASLYNTKRRIQK